MAQPERCPRCGTSCPTQGVPLDLCPACLLASALLLDDEPCPYQVVAPIGEGPHGVTYLAQPLTGAPGYVALKVLHPRDDTDAVLVRYRHWRPSLARVRHPSIARLVDVGLTSDGLVFLATEYVTGTSFATAATRGSFGQVERVIIEGQLRGAIDAAHRAGVVHLALDPAKVKISTAHGPHATILDLGWALIVEGAVGEPAVDHLALANLIAALDLDP